MGRSTRVRAHVEDHKFFWGKVWHRKPWSNHWDGVELGLTPVSGKPPGFSSQGMAEWVLGAPPAPHQFLQAPACPGRLRSSHPANPKVGSRCELVPTATP